MTHGGASMAHLYLFSDSRARWVVDRCGGKNGGTEKGKTDAHDESTEPREMEVSFKFKSWR